MQLFVNRALFNRIAADILAGAQGLVDRIAAGVFAGAQRVADGAQFRRIVADMFTRARDLPAHVNRLAGELFSGARARFYLMGMLALALAIAVDPSAAAIWLGGILLVDATRTVLVAHLPEFSPMQAGAARLSLDLAMNACLAAAPALAWFAPGGVSLALAAAMLCLLLGHAAFTSRHGRLHTVLACAPYALLGFLLLDAADADTIAPIASCLVCLAYGAGAALHHVHRASHLRLQDAEWVRQLSMTYGEGAAGWELDYAQGRLFGADRLSALLGRPVDYADIVERGCFAARADRALVKAALAPPRGPAHRIAIEHEAVCADGARVRLRHTGFVSTAPDGEPVRLTCVTRVSETPKAANAATPADAPLVLVIDDEPDAHKLATSTLTRVGFAVLGAVGGEAGLALARAKTPALVLLDIPLPDRAGVLQSLKHDPRTRDIPVIVLSAKDDRAHALALGAAEHMLKPSEGGRLAAAVLRFARKRPAVAQAPAQAAPGAAGAQKLAR